MQNEIEMSKVFGHAVGKFYKEKLDDLESRVSSLLLIAKDKNADASGLAIDLGSLNGFREMAESYNSMDDKHRQSFDKIVREFMDYVSKKVVTLEEKMSGKCVDTKSRFLPETERPIEKAASVNHFRNGVMISYNPTQTTTTSTSTARRGSMPKKPMFLMDKKVISYER
jgi:hypothetical protein